MKRPSAGRTLAFALPSVLVGSLMFACGSSSTGDGAAEPVGGQIGFGGTGTGIGLPNPNKQDSGTATPTPATGDANCGATTNELTKKPADLLLVLDRSSSMTRAMDSADDCAASSSSCSQRWETMTSSLSTVLASSPADVNWGLKFFTSPAASTTTGTGGKTGRGSTNACIVSPGVEVAVSPNNASAIQAQIDQAGTANSTPTRLAIEAAVTYLNTVNDGNPKYILLATDGEPNCSPGSTSAGSSDLAGTVTAVQNAAAAGYKVFVIGVGPETGNLTDLALAGGTEHYYPATTPAELSSALSTIVGTVAAGCTYQIGAAPPANPNAIGVYLDKSLVPQSGTNGWSFDSTNTKITINGSYCDDLTSGKKTLVEIFLPCNATDPIPPVIL